MNRILPQASKRRRRKGQEGFTLIEWMSAMMVMAIGVTALIAMHKAALDTHSANRDMQIAGGLADQFLEMLQVDSLRWQSGGPGNMAYFSASATASTATTTNWHRYTNQPVNYQMRYDSHKNATVQAGTGARFCVYYNWQWAGTSANKNEFNQELIEIDVAVLMPRNTSGLSNNATGCRNARTLFDTCSTTLLNDTTCTIDARRQLFRRLSRASMIRRNRSGL